jgi:hypothetical protein
MKNAFNKHVGAIALAGALATLAGGASAQSFPDFVVNEAAVAGAVANSFTADKITGNYDEVITFNGNAFQVSLLWNAGQYVGLDGTRAIGSQLGSVTANQYNMYALFTGNGTVNTNASGMSSFNFAPGGTLSIFIDPNSNNTFTAPATGTTAFSVVNGGDDFMIATGTPVSGQGTLDPNLPTCTGGAGVGINCGNFGASSSLGLTAQGSNYFTTPNPFYNLSFQSGQLNNFSPTGTQRINGSLDVIFSGTTGPNPNPNPNPVPEPATLAMLGLGILGLTAVRRRRSE